MATAGEKSRARDRILELSFYAFNQKGYKAVSMDMVARELRISKKTIYKYFNAKEEILETAIEQEFGRIEDLVAAIRKEKSERAALLQYFHLYKEFTESITPQLRAEIAEDIPYLGERIDTFEKQVLVRAFAQYMKDLRAKKLVVYPSPTRELAATWFSMLRGLVQAPEDKAEFIIAAFLKGIWARKKKQKPQKK